MNLLAHSFVHQKSSGCSCFLCSEFQKLKWSVWRSWLLARGSRTVSAPRLIRVVGRTQVHDSVGLSSRLLGGGQPGYCPPLSCKSHLHSLAGGSIHCQSQQQQVEPLWCLESLLPLFYPISLASARRVSAFECSCDSIGPTRLIPDTVCSQFLELAIVEVGIFIKGISVALTLSSFETRTCALMKKTEIYFFSCKFSWLPTISFSVLFDLPSITQKKKILTFWWTFVWETLSRHSLILNDSLWLGLNISSLLSIFTPAAGVGVGIKPGKGMGCCLCRFFGT